MKLRETVGAGFDYLAEHPKLQKSLAVLCVGGLVATGASEVKSSADSTDQSIARLQAQINGQQAQMDRLTEIAEGATGMSREGVLGVHLRKPDALPAYGTEVGKSDADALKQAAVKIYKQPKGSSGFWLENCSGTLISGPDSGTAYVLTARHCVANDTPGLKGAESDTEAVNITAIDPYRYGIMLGGETLSPDIPNPGATASEISMSMTSDMALMAFSDPYNTLDASERAFPIADHVKGPHKPGESTVAFSMPTAAGGKMLHGEGVYLGTTPSPDGDLPVDVIGLTNADIPAHDACNFGASGSSALLGGGYITGPLSTRSNLAYAEGAPENTPDDSSKQAQVNSRLKLEQALGVNTAGFNTLCQYTDLTDQSIPALLQGFNDPVQVPASNQGMK